LVEVPEIVDEPARRAVKFPSVAKKALVAVAFVKVALEKLPVPPWKLDAVTVPEKVALAAVMPLVTFSDVAVALPRTVEPEIERFVPVAFDQNRFVNVPVSAARKLANSPPVVVVPLIVADAAPSPPVRFTVEPVAPTKLRLVEVEFVDEESPETAPTTFPVSVPFT
jgi:hypothetical protein